MLSRLGSGVALASVAALVLVGCTPDEPVETTPPASPQPTAEDTTGQLRGQAESVYEDFLNTRSALTQSPDAEVDALLLLATDRQASATFAEVAELVQAGQMLEGRFRVTDASLVAEDATPLQAIICVDNSEVRIVDRETGDSQLASPAPPALVTFASDDGLKVDNVGEVPPEESQTCD